MTSFRDRQRILSSILSPRVSAIRFVFVFYLERYYRIRFVFSLQRPNSQCYCVRSCVYTRLQCYRAYCLSRYTSLAGNLPCGYFYLVFPIAMTMEFRHVQAPRCGVACSLLPWYSCSYVSTWSCSPQRLLSFPYHDLPRIRTSSIACNPFFHHYLDLAQQNQKPKGTAAPPTQRKTTAHLSQGGMRTDTEEDLTSGEDDVGCRKDRRSPRSCSCCTSNPS